MTSPKETSLASRSLGACGLLLGLSCAGLSSADAAVIIASGRNLSNPNYPTGAYYYSIDTVTGTATPISGLLPANGAAGLAWSGNQLVGTNAGTHGTINPVTGVFTASGTTNGFNLSGYEVLGGSGYSVPFLGTDRRLHQIDFTTSTAIGIGIGNPIGMSMDVFYGNAAGTNTPSIASLGSVGGTLYGVNSGAGKYNLIALNPLTGNATIIGAPNAVATSGNAGARYDGFSAMTGVDENGDGVYDSLYGNVNFYDPDGLTGSAPDQNFGGVVRYNLTDGTWNLVGSNSGVIFLGFASVPEPSTAALSALGLAAVLRRRRTK